MPSKSPGNGLGKPASFFARHNAIVYLAFVLTVILFSIVLGPKFLSLNNVLNITRQTAMISIMAVGMTFVIGAAQIDLSIGSITAFSALLAAMLINATGSIAVGVVGGVGFGAVVGAVNGYLVTWAGIPAFLVTLGTMSIVRGGAMWITNMAAVPIQNKTFNFYFGTGDLFRIPILLYWTVLFAVLGYFLLNHLPFGRKVLATGGNVTAARFTGINTDAIKVKVMLMCGALAGMAGVLYAGRMQAGRYTYGTGDEMSVIAAVILGGTSMAGGNGTIVGSIMGLLLMGVINNGLVLGGLSVAQQSIVRGAIIIIATAIGSRSNQRTK
ncbi:MAG: ABC transporter permease [Planctomycetaceae bacterium]|nr:ABC transporter permease [Planctomycetaceae bacterium]